MGESHLLVEASPPLAQVHLWWAVATAHSTVEAAHVCPGARGGARVARMAGPDLVGNMQPSAGHVLAKEALRRAGSDIQGQPPYE